MNIPTHTSNVTKYSDFLISIYKLQVSNYIFQLLHSNIDEEIESSLCINNQIPSHNTRTNNQMSILRVNRSKTKHCVLHNGMITWNFNVQEQGTKFLSRKILENIDAGRHYDCIFFLTCLQLRFL